MVSLKTWPQDSDYYNDDVMDNISATIFLPTFFKNLDFKRKMDNFKGKEMV